MEVVIAGAGSMGLLIGSFLSEAGVNVSFFTRREEQAARLRECGVTRVTNGKTCNVAVSAFSKGTTGPRNAIWIVSVKSGQLLELVNEMELHHHPRYVLFIQNGIRHLEIGTTSSFLAVGVASLTHGAQKIDDTTVAHRGMGTMNLAHVKGEPTGLDQLLEFESTAFPMQKQLNAREMLLRKAIINCCINPLTSLLRISNGELMTNESAHHLMGIVYNELAAVYPEITLNLPFSDVEEVCVNTSKNRSSMLTDLEKGVPMEIDTIVTAVLGNSREDMPTLTTLEQMLIIVDGRVEDG